MTQKGGPYEIHLLPDPQLAISSEDSGPPKGSWRTHTLRVQLPVSFLASLSPALPISASISCFVDCLLH